MHSHTPLQKPIDKGATILVEINVSSKEKNARFLLFDRFKFSDSSDSFVELNTFSRIWPVIPKYICDFSSYDFIDAELN